MYILATTEREYPWGTLRSTNSSKVKVILEEKGLAYRVDRLRPGNLWKKPPELLAKHPLGKVPYLQSGDTVVYDSTVINEYLEDLHPEPSLRPSDPDLLARVRMLENFGDEAILVGDLPKIWMPMWSDPKDRDEEAMEAGRQGLRQRAFPYLEGELAGRDYLCGAFTLADAPYMAMAMVLQVDGTDVGEFPHLNSYLDRLRARPSYKSIDPATSLADSEGSA